MTWAAVCAAPVGGVKPPTGRQLRRAAAGDFLPHSQLAVPTSHGRGREMWKDFKAFLMRGNVLDLAVGIIIGGAFGTIVTSLVNDVIMPPVGLALGKVDFSNLKLLLQAGPKAPPPYASVAEAKAAGAVTINYGMFINSVISFLIVGFAVFLVVRLATRLQRPEAAVTPTTKPCPACTLAIPIQAKRCPNCTSEV